MIAMNSQLAQELGLTYWQIAEADEDPAFQINHEEKELLRKILHAKAIDLTDDILKVEADGVALVSANTYQLIFDDVNKVDKGKSIHLAKLSDMLKDSNQKKLTWFKLKNLNFY